MCVIVFNPEREIFCLLFFRSVFWFSRLVSFSTPASDSLFAYIFLSFIFDSILQAFVCSCAFTNSNSNNKPICGLDDFSVRICGSFQIQKPQRRGNDRADENDLRWVRNKHQTNYKCYLGNDIYEKNCKRSLTLGLTNIVVRRFGFIFILPPTFNYDCSRPNFGPQSSRLGLNRDIGRSILMLLKITFGSLRLKSIWQKLSQAAWQSWSSFQSFWASEVTWNSF